MSKSRKPHPRATHKTSRSRANTKSQGNTQKPTTNNDQHTESTQKKLLTEIFQLIEISGPTKMEVSHSFMTIQTKYTLIFIQLALGEQIKVAAYNYENHDDIERYIDLADPQLIPKIQETIDKIEKASSQSLKPFSIARTQ